MEFLSRFLSDPPKAEDYSKSLKDPMSAVYWKMTVEFGEMYIRMYFEWVKKCKKQPEEIRDDIGKKTPERQSD